MAFAFLRLGFCAVGGAMQAAHPNFLPRAFIRQSVNIAPIAQSRAKAGVVRKAEDGAVSPLSSSAFADFLLPCRLQRLELMAKGEGCI
ncbi:hypothetical protein [Aurantiacibacter suaedae]|uniref:hypothetical protein n=1 Tax=Aurantiacibacter suaedae TaxID=2545755 RepID=UPI0010F46C03|nr:hypothetical protein [Aurantiacibacter suaedae]